MLYEDVLKEKSERFTAFLEKNGFLVKILLYRDYMSRVGIAFEGEDKGYIDMWYKPTKNLFSIKAENIKPENVKKFVYDLWEEFYGGVPKKKDDGFTECYIDGSFIESVSSDIGYGIVIIKGGEVIKELSGVVTEPELHGSRQVGGEMKAVIEALRWCKENKIYKVRLYHDFLNLSLWAKGIYKTNKEISIYYKKMVDMYMAYMDIDWVKVAGHTGVRWNERVDKLAKNAITGE